MTTLWLDGYAFARRVICAGREPWNDPAQLGAAYRDLQKLLPVDFQVLPLSPLFETLHSKVEGAQLSAEAFDRMIQERVFLDSLSTGLDSMLASGLGARIALCAPGPSVILGERGAIEFDDADRILSGICEVVRICGGRIAAILIDEDRDDALEPADAVVNVAQHAGLRAALIAREKPPANSALFNPIFSRIPEAACPWLGAEWFSAAYPCPTASDIMLSPPEGCAPEAARDRIATARAGA